MLICQSTATRDVSFGPRTRDGAKAWGAFMTLAETATKLGVSFSHYMSPAPISCHPLPTSIAEQVKVLNLATSSHSQDSSMYVEAR